MIKSFFWQAQVDTITQLSDSTDSLKDLFADITATRLMRGLVSILIAYGLIWLITAFTNWLSEQAPRRFRLVIKQSVPFFKAVILVLAIGYLIKLFINLSETNLLALTGTVAVTLGFAFKDYVSSIIAGVVTLFEGPFRMGDRVQVGEHYGEVIDYGLRGMRLQTPEDTVVTIPHNTVWTKAVANANSGQLEAQVITSFYFGHGADLDAVTQILHQAAYSSRYTQLQLPVVVVMDEKPWGTEFRLKAYPMDARDEFIYKTDLIRQAKQACDRLQLPYPQWHLSEYGKSAAERSSVL